MTFIFFTTIAVTRLQPEQPAERVHRCPGRMVAGVPVGVAGNRDRGTHPERPDAGGWACGGSWCVLPDHSQHPGGAGPAQLETRVEPAPPRLGVRPCASPLR